MVPRLATIDKRDALIDLLADHLLDVGIAGASLRSFATAAGTSDRMLLYYFADKAEIMAAALQRVAERQTEALADFTGAAKMTLDDAARAIIGFATAAPMWPAMRLWLEVAAAAARGDALCRSVGEAIARGFVAWGRERLTSPVDRLDADTARLMLMVEGAVFLQSVGLADVVALATAPQSPHR